MLAIMRADIYATFLKVVNDRGEIIAAAKWNIYDRVLPPEFDVDGSYWKDDEEKEYAQHMFRMYLAPRCKAIKESGGPLVSLDVMIVHPEHQRQGAGRMLAKWGTKIADEMGVETVVEATDYGRGLYSQEGFEVLEEYELPLPEKWANRPRQRFWWMKRPVTARSN